MFPKTWADHKGSIVINRRDHYAFIYHDVYEEREKNIEELGKGVHFHQKPKVKSHTHDQRMDQYRE